MYGFFFFFFFRLICWLDRMHHACVSKDKWVFNWRLKTEDWRLLVNCALSKKSDYSLLRHSLFEKWKSLESLRHGIFAEVGLPYFQVLHFQCWNQGLPWPKEKEEEKQKLGPLTQREKRNFFYWLYIFIFKVASFSFKNLPLFFN